jgi:hypothetical protein
MLLPRDGNKDIPGNGSSKNKNKNNFNQQTNYRFLKKKGEKHEAARNNRNTLPKKLLFFFCKWEKSIKIEVAPG